MKKFVLIMFCTLLVLVFIAFNYLLWDRENKVKDLETLAFSNASNKASIEVLGREIKKLEDDNKLLKERLAVLEEDKARLTVEKGLLEQEISDADKRLEQKAAVLDKLKQYADLKPVEAPIRQWVEALDEGNYEAAYGLMKNAMEKQGESLTLEDFTRRYKGSVKSIKLKSLELLTKDVPENRKGDILFKASLEVKKAENGAGGDKYFGDGINERYISVGYAGEKDEWFLDEIAARP